MNMKDMKKAIKTFDYICNLEYSSSAKQIHNLIRRQVIMNKVSHIALWVLVIILGLQSGLSSLQTNKLVKIVKGVTTTQIEHADAINTIQGATRALTYLVVSTNTEARNLLSRVASERKPTLQPIDVTIPESLRKSYQEGSGTTTNGSETRRF